MKTIKILSRVFSAVVLTTLCMSIAGCSNSATNSTSPGGTTKSVKNLTIGLSLPTEKTSYFVALAKDFTQVCKAKGWKLIITDANDSEVTQNSDCQDLVSKGVDAIVIDPRDSKAAIATSLMIAKSNIPLFTIDSTIGSGGKYVSQVTSANSGDGFVVGEWVAKKMGNKMINIGMLSGNQGNDCGLTRRSGLIEGITEYQLQTYNKTNFKIVCQGWGGWDTPDGMKAAEDMLSTTPEMNVLLTENDAMGLGAMKAFQNASRSDILIAAAADGQKEAYAAIKAGTYGATGLNDPMALVQTTDQQIHDYFSGIKITQTIETPAICISKDNVNKYFKADAIF